MLHHRMELWQQILTGIAGGSLIILTFVWEFHDPWSIFIDLSFGRLGIPEQYVNDKNMKIMFNHWKSWGYSLTVLFQIITLSMFGLRFIMIRPVAVNKTWPNLRSIIFFTYILFAFLIFVVPTLFYSFEHAVSLNTSNLEQSWLYLFFLLFFFNF